MTTKHTTQLDLFNKVEQVNQDQITKTVPASIPGEKQGATFDGAAYVEEFDYSRLKGQMLKIWELMKGGAWYTLQEISQHTNAPEASASAQLRNFRKDKFGGHTVERRRRGDRTSGLFEYKLIQKDEQKNGQV